MDTLERAKDSYPGWGWSDWWYNRYVTVYCTDPPDLEDCKKYPNSPAYTNSAAKGQKYPVIVYCDLFFTNLTSHATVVEKIKNDKTGDKKFNLRNMRSQATTVLHESLHLKGTSAEVCLGGCEDVFQEIGGRMVRSYKTGKAKLLALRDPELASINNDNYAYFAMARWVQENLQVTPQFPSCWNANISPEENQRNEDNEPGAKESGDSLEIEDSGLGETMTGAAPGPASEYPEWYRPKIEAIVSGQHNPVTPPTRSTPPAIAVPKNDSVVCETSDGSPLIKDCVHAFGSINNPAFTQMGARHRKKGETWWAGYVHSCALAVYYFDDWNDNCGATFGDVYGHARAIFDSCSNGGMGKVGGRVPLNVANCSAQVEIIKTDDIPSD